MLEVFANKKYGTIFPKIWQLNNDNKQKKKRKWKKRKEKTQRHRQDKQGASCVIVWFLCQQEYVCTRLCLICIIVLIRARCEYICAQIHVSAYRTCNKEALQCATHRHVKHINIRVVASLRNTGCYNAILSWARLKTCLKLFKVLKKLYILFNERFVWMYIFFLHVLEAIRRRWRRDKWIMLKMESKLIL